MSFQLNQPSAYSHRRYTDGGDSEKRRDRQLQEQQQQQYIKDRLEQHEQQMAANKAAQADHNGSGNGKSQHIEMFQIDDHLNVVNSMYPVDPEQSSTITLSATPKTFRAETIADDCAQNRERKVLPQTSDFVPINVSSSVYLWCSF